MSSHAGELATAGYTARGPLLKLGISWYRIVSSAVIFSFV